MILLKKYFLTPNLSSHSTSCWETRAAAKLDDFRLHSTCLRPQTSTLDDLRLHATFPRARTVKLDDPRLRGTFPRAQTTKLDDSILHDTFPRAQTIKLDDSILHDTFPRAQTTKLYYQLGPMRKYPPSVNFGRGWRGWVFSHGHLFAHSEILKNVACGAYKSP